MKGLTNKQVQSQIKKYGYNEIPVINQWKKLKILLEQFNSFLVIILLLAGFTSIILQEFIDGIAIIAIVVVNAIIGFIQEYKAENAVAKLKTLVVPTTIVIRNEKETSIPIRELVPNDIVILSEGDKIPADLKIIESFSLKVDESMLTGESVPVNKDISKDQEIELFKGTIITSGRAVAKVVKTGIHTEFGKIVKLLNKNTKSRSPLSIQLDQLGHKIGIVTLIMVSVLFILGWIRGISIFEMLMTSVALGVSAIPEGMPIIVTLTLAMGVQILARKNAIVRKMNAVETLGATTVICSDKTGTLTLNEMTVSKIYTNFTETEIPGLGYKFKKHKIKLTSPEAKQLLAISENCNNSFVDKEIIGDPTEIALKIFARKAGYSTQHKKLDEKVFTSERKMMSTHHQIAKEKITFSKGAFEEILKKSTHILKKGKVSKITAGDKKKITEAAIKYSEQALRVLGFAYRKGEFTEKNLTFVGLTAMIDPPRKTVKASLATAMAAGIKVKIITGDNAITAKAIGEQIGLTSENIITGVEIDKLKDKELYQRIKETQIFARTKPEHKYRIVDLLKKHHEVVAVTGDGVNDAPALKHADVGIAMGIKGTEATKEVADIILKDDNFSTIVKTIREGRRIYQNILNFIKYMLSVNFITIVVVGILTLFGLPLPLLPLQILWINIATDALPALALGRSPAASNLMLEKPHPKKENIFRKFFKFILITGLVQTIANLFAYFYGTHMDLQFGINNASLEVASHTRTMVFTQIVMFELIFAFVIAKTKNRFLMTAVAISFILQLFVIYTPAMQAIFKTVPLNLEEWLIIIVLASSGFLVPILNRKR